MTDLEQQDLPELYRRRVKSRHIVNSLTTEGRHLMHEISYLDGQIAELEARREQLLHDVSECNSQIIESAFLLRQIAQLIIEKGGADD